MCKGGRLKNSRQLQRWLRSTDPRTGPLELHPGDGLFLDPASNRLLAKLPKTQVSPPDHVAII